MKRIMRVCTHLIIAAGAFAMVISCGGLAAKDQAAVTAAVEKLAVGYASGDSAAKVTQNLTLPTNVDGVTVSWASSNSAVVGTDGKVNRPDVDTPVTLTATLTKNAATGTKPFVVLVLKKEAAVADSDKTAVSAAKTKLNIGYAAGDSAETVTQNLTLPTNIDGVTVTWTSSHPAVVGTDGNVNRPDADTQVTLTAMLTKNAAKESKVFTVTVPKKPNLSDPDTRAVETAKGKLDIGYASGDSAAKVTQSLTLPTNIDGVTVSWTSSNPAVVGTDGTVSRPDADAQVTLTAMLTKNAAKTKKALVVTVIRDMDKAAVAAAKAKLTITYASGDSASQVTQKLTLPTNVDGVTVTWTSSHPAVVGTDGTVSRLDADAQVTLAAMLTKNAAHESKVFTVTVKGSAADWVAEQLSHAAVSPMEITKSDYHITLSGTNISWTSGDTAVIAVTNQNSGTYPVTPRSDIVRVTLTAKAEKAGVSDTRAFTVTVYPEAYSLETLEHLKKITLPAEVDADFDLPTTIDGLPGANIMWMSKNEQAIRIAGGSSKAIVMQDLRAVPVTLIATLNDNGKKAEKDFTVTVKKITEIRDTSTSSYSQHTITTVYTFTDNTITHEYTDKDDRTGIERKDGYRAAFSDLNLSDHTFTAYKTHQRFNDGQLVEIGSAEYQRRNDKQIEESVEYHRRYKQLSERSSISLQDIREAFKDQPLPSDDEGIFNQIKDFLVTGTYEDFKNLTPQKRTDMIKSQLEKLKQAGISLLGLSTTASWDDVLEALRQSLKEKGQKEKTLAQTPFKYRYTLQKSGNGTEFVTNSLYDSTRAWFKQHGSYSAHLSGSRITYISLDDTSLQYREQGGSKHYSGKIDSAGMRFEGKLSGDPDKTLTVSITDNRNGTISIILEGTSYNLSFSARSL